MVGVVIDDTAGHNYKASSLRYQPVIVRVSPRCWLDELFSSSSYCSSTGSNYVVSNHYHYLGNCAATVIH